MCAFWLFCQRKTGEGSSLLCVAQIWKHKSQRKIVRMQGKTCMCHNSHRGDSTLSYLISNPCLILIWGSLWEVTVQHTGSDRATKGKWFRFGPWHPEKIEILLCLIERFGKSEESPAGVNILSELLWFFLVASCATLRVVSDWYWCGCLKAVRWRKQCNPEN